MKTKITHRTGNIFIAQYGLGINVDSIQKNLIFLADNGLSTFGSINTEILCPLLKKQNLTIESSDLCLEDDLTLGLQMPDTWYLNRGVGAISISMYYNFLYFKEMAKQGVLFTKNQEAFSQYGRIGIIEVYSQDKLEEFMLANGINYFGTPRTLTECMRVLEGWDIERIPRLRSYVPYSEFIRIWCKDFYPGFRKSEWGLGQRMSSLILEGTGTTNVRESIKFFWQNYLLKRPQKISAGDVEIDILSRKFYENRQPDYILVGEDIFTEEASKSIITFREFSTNRIISASHSKEKNEKDMATALLAQQLFPGAKIIIFRNNKPLPNFTMCKLDEIKKGINREVGVIAEVMTSLIREFK